MKRVVGALCAVAAFLGPVSAQMIGQPAGILPNFDVENLTSALEEIGGETEILMIGGGMPTVGVRMSTSNTKFLLRPTACGEDMSDCKGVSIRALFSAGAMSPTGVNVFNRFGTVPKAVHEGDLVVLYHYMVADHGALRGNFETNIRIMEDAILAYRGFLDAGSAQDPAAQSVSLGVASNHVGGNKPKAGRHPRLMSTFIAPPRDFINE